MLQNVFSLKATKIKRDDCTNFGFNFRFSKAVSSKNTGAPLIAINRKCDFSVRESRVKTL